MYWSFDYQGESYISWGSPRSEPFSSGATNMKSRFDIEIYDGKMIEPSDKICFMMQGSADLGLGDSIWLINFMRDIYRIKSRRRGQFYLISGGWVLNFYQNFLPSSFNFVQEYLLESDFMQIEHKLPAMYYWQDTNDNADRSWTDNKSLVQRLYNWSGLEYNGLADWGEFTNEKILYPSDDFWSSLNLNKKDKYVFFQWHSSGHAKNLPPRTNIKLLKHIVKKYGYKVYVVGRLNCLDMLDNIPGVVNLSGKTEGNAEALFTLAFNSEFVVCPDSAGVHMAEAYKIPAVCLMATLPPSYICSKYKIPAFMYGSGHCPYSPCGVVHRLPKDRKCPSDTGDYCKVFNDINLDLFDSCVTKTFENRMRYKSEKASKFYKALDAPISLVYP